MRRTIIAFALGSLFALPAFAGHKQVSGVAGDTKEAKPAETKPADSSGTPSAEKPVKKSKKSSKKVEKTEGAGTTAPEGTPSK
jgi:hypothetical protein